METIEGNKLIAEFMGAIEQSEQIKPARAPLGKMYFPGTSNRFPDLMFTCYAQDLRYNSSWDWIMPVVERMDFGTWLIRPGFIKFESYKGELLPERQFAFHTSQMDWETENQEPVEFIFLLHTIVVKGIQWYNTTKPQPNAK